MNKKTERRSKKKAVLIAGHPMVVDVNRSVWNALADRNTFDVDLVVPKNWKSNLIKKLNFSYNPDTDDKLNEIYTPHAFFMGNGSLTFFNPFKLWLILNTKKYEQIILTQETWSISLLVFTLVSLFTINFRTGIDLWVCQNLKKDKLKWLIPFEKINCLKVDNILCCCAEIEEVITWKALRKKCRYFPFSFSAQQYQSLKPMDTFSGVLKLGYIGRLSEEKGMQLLFDLCEHMNDKGLAFELHLAGSGPWEKKWKELAAKDQRIKFYGVLKHTEAFQFYEKIHAIVLPSLTKPFWKEQFGRVIIEAAASGRVVIGSSSGAIPEVMKEVGMPFNFQEGSLDSLTENLELCFKMLENNELVSIIEKSKKLTFEKYDHQSVAQRAELYLLNPKENDGIIIDSKLST
jgi:glycosyltransferase involved in cell wall biosynthesis